MYVLNGKVICCVYWGSVRPANIISDLTGEHTLATWHAGSKRQELDVRTWFKLGGPSSYLPSWYAVITLLKLIASFQQQCFPWKDIFTTWYLWRRGCNISHANMGVIKHFNEMWPSNPSDSLNDQVSIFIYFCSKNSGNAWSHWPILCIQKITAQNTRHFNPFKAKWISCFNSQMCLVFYLDITQVCGKGGMQSCSEFTLHSR